jgi:hypothetical protein
MNNKAKSILMLVAAAYILYTGITTLKGALEGATSSSTIFTVIGIVFIVFGIAAIIFYGKLILKEVKEVKEVKEESEELKDEMIDTNETIESSEINTTDKEINS